MSNGRETGGIVCLVFGIILIAVGVVLFFLPVTYFGIFTVYPYRSVGTVIGTAGVAVLVVGVVLYSTAEETRFTRPIPYYPAPAVGPYVPPVPAWGTTSGEPLTAPKRLSVAQESDGSDAPVASKPSPPPPMPAPPISPSHVVRYVVIAVVAVIVVGLTLGVGIPLLQQAASAPNIVLTDEVYYVSGCGFFGNPYYTITWYITLANTGTASGFATITAYLNGAAVGYVQYFVASGSQIHKGFYVNTSDCATYSPTIAITSVTKA